MHCVDQGVGQLIVGNVIVSACLQGAFGNDVSMSVKLERCYEDYVKWCKSHDIRSRLEMFTVDHQTISVVTASECCVPQARMSHPPNSRNVRPETMCLRRSFAHAVIQPISNLHKNTVFTWGIDLVYVMLRAAHQNGS